MTTYRTLGDARRAVVGDGDSFHYRSLTGRTIKLPASRRVRAVWLCSESERYGYRGITRIDRAPGGGWIVADAEIFEQDAPRSFSSMLRDAAELGWCEPARD